MGDKRPNQILYADTKKLQEMSKLLEKFPQVGELAVTDVMRDARDYVVRTIPRIVPNEFAIDRKAMRSALGRRRVRSISNGADRTISIEVVGNRLKATRFTHTPTAPPSIGNSYKTAVTIYNNRGSKVLKKIPGADGKKKSVFIAKTGAKNSDKVPFIFFVRTGEYYGKKPKRRKVNFGGGKVSFMTSKGYEKIRPISTIGIPQMVTSNAVAKPLMDGLAAMVDKTITKNLDRSLQEMCNKLNR
ncbi:hypothetical protein EDD70_2970 [Hydrogenoanaerobacterium saccharovorans]|uniref:Prophage minor tail protein Z (GPZ) n=2 Tax=Hydrogenoanaerobacterium saccharovorans TaxID=474960 RepID=A0A1H7YHR3_9FIRM|nr:hypothetical protein EDD70_2970 [Hydrogenoanaerobacterium saccharovorans]SEM45650.1 hypothetical protein SAMN05216180_0053 [Hydrogenoanaerobacterium saccharovorans]